MVRHFDLGPTQLTVEAENDGLLGGFERFLGERGQPGVAASTFLVSIRVSEPEPAPADAELLYSGPLPKEGTCDFARIGQTYFMSFPEEARMVIDPQARRADIVVARDRPQRARGSVVPIAVEFALDLEDQQVVHAAGLSLPAEGGMVLVSAPSGTGKTTTALALARSGLSFAADDIMVLRREPGSIVAWGLPRALNVHRNTAAMQPWLNLQPQWNAEGEQAVPRRNLASGVQLEDRELPVTRLVLLQRGERTKMEPLAPTDMLAALAADNVRNSTSGLTPLQGRRFAMLADLVRAVPAYKVTMAAGLSDIEVIASELAK
ncbi:MAG: hypothetical protein KF810_00915 [Rhizobiaceae bacterium]|nr:hypothetical protein [Rhizobiaceae bacterium]